MSELDYGINHYLVLFLRQHMSESANESETVINKSLSIGTLDIPLLLVMVKYALYSLLLIYGVGSITLNPTPQSVSTTLKPNAHPASITLKPKLHDTSFIMKSKSQVNVSTLKSKKHSVSISKQLTHQ